MKPNHYLAMLALLNAMLFCFSDVSFQAGGAEDGPYLIGQTSSDKGGKTPENADPQWSADPERGWIRSDERHENRDQRQSGEKPVQNGKKQKRNEPKVKGTDAPNK